MTARPERTVGPNDGPADPQGRSAVVPNSSAEAQTSQALRDAWVIVELAPDAVLVIDEHGDIELANRATEVMFGYDRNALSHLGVDALVPDGRRAAHRGHRAAFDASPQTRPMGLDVDLWARRADGSEFPVAVSLSPVSFGQGARVVAIVRDVTDHRASEHTARDLVVLADEERIGAALRHGVIRRLFAAGLNIQAVVNRVEPQVAQRLLDAVDELDLAIREIRDTVILPARRPDQPAA